MTNRRRLRFYLPLPVLAVAALVWPLSRPEAAPTRSAGEVAYSSLPDKPQGEVKPGRAGVEPSAIALAHWLHALPSAPGSQTPCAEADLYVSWTAPAAMPPHGAYVGALGPAPTATTDAVNGIVLCTGSETDTLMGFRARYVDDRWDVVATPDAGDEEALPEVTTPEPVAPNNTPVPSVALDGRTFTASVEGLAAYEPQRTCDGTSKPGTTALRNLLLKENVGSRNLGIVRGCSIGGTSEHKEGRAFDWGVNVHSAKEKAEADAFTAKLLAADQFGNKYALARRMGVMYVIWNQRIWSAYRADEGWRPYHGASAHTDHVHISLSWAGAQARTSFWSGNVVQVLLASAPKSVSDGVRSAQGTTTRRVASVSTQLAATEKAKRDAERRAAWEQAKADRAAARAEWEKEHAADDAARAAKRAEQLAKWEADKAAREVARQEAADKAAADKVVRDAARDAARQAAADKYAADKAARDAARQAAADQAATDKAARDQAYAERKAAEAATREAARQAAVDKATADAAARAAARQAAAEKAAADAAARAAARQAAAEKAAADRAARDAARRNRSTTTTTAPRATTTTAPAPTTTAPATTPTTQG